MFAVVASVDEVVAVVVVVVVATAAAAAAVSVVAIHVVDSFHPIIDNTVDASRLMKFDVNVFVVIIKLKQTHLVQFCARQL